MLKVVPAAAARVAWVDEEAEAAEVDPVEPAGTAVGGTILPSQCHQTLVTLTIPLSEDREVCQGMAANLANLERTEVEGIQPTNPQSLIVLHRTHVMASRPPTRAIWALGTEGLREQQWASIMEWIKRDSLFQS